MKVEKIGTKPKIKEFIHATKGRERLFKFILVLGILFILWVVYVQWKILTPNESNVVGQRVDVGIILGASLWGDEPSPGLQERLDHALMLYEKGVFTHFIVSGGLDSPQHKYTEAEGMERYLARHGVDPKHIFLENEATSTYENLLYSKRIMAEQGFHSSVIITHDFHGMRSLEIAKFLDYEVPTISLAESVVMPFLPSQIRETLAYSKWKMDQVLLSF
ncbi:YdcF family protein [Paenibacillus sp. Marseille-Q4541]|uniref:YdcF family protein n=1 Tax=Paenibacillus sp. Marseille-Q4541 TaxID=2831522 RepID=UPI001BA8712F|nr:YdcF family protein [Paenibacillus sp. Marseille-Q4541]